jgi:hypothetical protein
MVRSKALPALCGLASLALAVLSGCGASFQYGAQHAHVLPKKKLEVHTALQFDMLPEPVHGKACADSLAIYQVVVMGTVQGLSRGEQAAAQLALRELGDTADALFLTSSHGYFNDSGDACGEVWGRALRLRATDYTPPPKDPNAKDEDEGGGLFGGFKLF